MIDSESLMSMAGTSADLVTIEAGENVSVAAARMAENHIGALMVMNGERVAGIITERDVTVRVVAANLEPNSTRIEQVMTRKLICCSLETSISTAQQVMAENGIRHLPLVEQGLPVGMLSVRDVLQHQLASVRALAIKQSRILSDLEGAYPGITSLNRDEYGRIRI
ncbi:MAG: cyclic nucleotide-binding/CBS domain-containing protein [Phycisphaerae bacterium]